MKLVTIDVGGEDRPGVLLGDTILDLKAAGGAADSVMAILEGGSAALDDVKRLADSVDGRRDELQAAGALVDEASATYLPPIPKPGLILSVGMNYAAHLEEMNTPIPKEPAAFIKSQHSLTGHRQPIRIPRDHPDMVDFEGEFTFVIGRDCHQVSEAEAMGCIGGYTIANDVSARDWVPAVFASEGTMPAIHNWEKNILGKNFPTFTPLGPVITTADEIDDPGALRLITRLDGEVMQDTLTELVFSVPRIISHYSQWHQFRAGDVVTTGSPSGVGYGRDPKVFMKPGQTIEIEIEGVGTLSNPVVLAD